MGDEKRRRQRRSRTESSDLELFDSSAKSSRVSRRLKLSIWLLIALNFVTLVIGAMSLLVETSDYNYDGREHASELHQSAFQKSIEIASYTDENRVSHILKPLEKSNPMLQWKQTEDAESGMPVDWVKTVVWVSNTGYTNYYKSLEEQPDSFGVTPPERPVVWVTLAPQVQQFCKKHTNNANIDVSYRLKQYLGLNPERRYERFVELWVKPDDIFRPCPDPETNDRFCNLEVDKRVMPKVPNVSDYPAFLRQLSIESYGPDGAPWTRLGYTYDWAPGETNVGASEYMLVPEAQYTVAGSHSTDEYCGLDD